MGQFPVVVALSARVQKKESECVVGFCESHQINALSLMPVLEPLGCLSPVDTPGLIGVLTPISMDPRIP